VTETVSQTPYFLGAVTNENRSDEQWTVQFTIGTTPVKFKIDTGADVNIMGEETFNKIIPDKKLESSNHTNAGAEGVLDHLQGELNYLQAAKIKHTKHHLK